MDGVTGLANTQAKINIFKPNRVESLVQSADLPQYIAANHKERAGRLVDFAGGVEITIQTAVAPIHRVRGPQTIDEKDLEQKCRGSGKGADIESRLGSSVLVDEPAAGGADLRKQTTLDEGLQAALENGVVIQQEHE